MKQICGLKVKVTGNKNVKIVFTHIFVESRSIYVKPTAKQSPARSAHIVKFHQWKCFVLWCL